MALLEVRDLKKIYSSRFSGTQVQALDNVNFDVQEGEFVAIMGESGSGKTTLLNILAALDRPTAGKVLLNGRDLGKERAAFRRSHLGFVFQDFNLLDTFTNKDNALLPLVLAKEKYPVMMKKLTPLAETLGISSILKKYPYEVSGGQKQRVSIARALITNPEILLADEPTGALDSRSSEDVLNLFTRINQEGQTILMVTHSMKAASYAGRVLFIKDGRVFHQIYKGDRSSSEFYEDISRTLTMMSRKGERA
ncbi:ABC transporter ATP-binding protein [Faecalibaculum rodentium]|uniref:ABC transporter ATP-binding protein n=1 Tax=Faecalibaculum rodentium TaxID=1702221 RepID=UPI00255AB918|nr:ABC transporter ATP-binding protein [Faecalibaculum rodentium]